MVSTTAAIVAGLVAGVALIVAFSVLDANPSFQNKYAKNNKTVEVTIPEARQTNAQSTIILNHR
ncbi:hypothetical protein NTE_02440 [Candidatus Nitrososphaera evergladensis SR1]|jgi:hypothetical protein|uniref:Uncharacterized protein n=1 Tax=Candidatus Nitrososphaera evergladensis SR1 TaxID=1459636 RepID=A0A075MTG2_9ARCH|nr:hypothetical protein [Candidatus Nitrososphaera evergladensis]AIF84490.1 hypothetical protein NTE_02440 [Candidatus Nitrososphaera evergladensis SR1]